jgi:hypothetical protein
MRRRRELSERPDVSQRMRELSRSSSHHAALDTTKRSPLLATLGIAAGVGLMLACVLSATAAVASGLWFQSRLSDAPTTVQNFYSALHEQDYARAYSYLSTAAQKRTPQDAFTAQFTSLDEITGVVDTYTITSSSATGAGATVTVDVVRRGSADRAQTQTLTLVQQGGAWHIDTITTGGSQPVSDATT